jgi:hypothetical protein
MMKCREVKIHISTGSSILFTRLKGGEASLEGISTDTESRERVNGVDVNNYTR